MLFLLGRTVLCERSTVFLLLLFTSVGADLWLISGALGLRLLTEAAEDVSFDLILFVTIGFTSGSLSESDELIIGFDLSPDVECKLDDLLVDLED